MTICQLYIVQCEPFHAAIQALTQQLENSWLIYYKNLEWKISKNSKQR